MSNEEIELEVFVSKVSCGWTVSCPAISMFVKTRTLDSFEENVRWCVDLFFREISVRPDPKKILEAIGWKIGEVISAPSSKREVFKYSFDRKIIE